MPKRPITAADLLRLQFVSDPRISPNGERILFCKKHIVTDKNKYVTNLYVVDLSGHVHQMTSGDAGASHGRWSKDGTQIAFISGREKPTPQIFLLPVSGGEAQQLSKLPEGSLGGFKWSPDGKHIAFTFRETHPDWTEAAKKKRVESGGSEPPKELDDIWYRLDGDGYFGPQRHKLYVLNTSTGEHRLICDRSPLGSYSFDWSPNSMELAVSYSVERHPFRDKPNEQIFRYDLDGAGWQLEGLPKGEKTALEWSPDGEWIAYIGEEHEDDPWGVYNGHLCVVPAGGGERRDLTAADDYCMNAATLSDTRDAAFGGYCFWSPDSKALYFNVGWHGESQLGFVQLDKPGVQLLTKGKHFIEGVSLSQSGEKLACTFGHPTRLFEIGVYDLTAHGDGPEVLTSFNAEFHDEVKLSEPEEVWLDSTDGSKLHVWVMKPIGYLEPQRYPAVLEIHGGPHTQYGWSFMHEFQVLAAQGYVVVYSNPRGSKGYGEAHCAAIRGDWGTKDWEDMQTVIRWMQHQPYIHPGQMGVMGGSYGGYMTNWIVGHCNDFKAAITDRCVSNLVSMAGNSDFPSNKDGYFGGYAWGGIEAITPLWRQSPLAYFDQVKCPMLIIHSEGDLRCNVEQGEQVFSALQMQGIESRFVRYPSSTFHGLSRSGPPDLRLHRLGEITKWWDRHLKGNG